MVPRRECACFVCLGVLFGPEGLTSVIVNREYLSLRI